MSTLALIGLLCLFVSISLCVSYTLPYLEDSGGRSEVHYGSLILDIYTSFFSALIDNQKKKTRLPIGVVAHGLSLIPFTLVLVLFVRATI